MSKSELPSQDEQRLALKELVGGATEAFLVPAKGDELLAPVIDALGSLRPPFDEIGRTFCANVSGLVATVTIPYVLAHASALDRHYQRMWSAERIRSLKLEETDGESTVDLEARRENTASEIATARMNEFVSSAEGRDAIIRDTCQFLLRALRDPSLASAAAELLLQGIVLCWSAFEVFARDTFIALLNLYPSRVSRLLEDPVAKRRFEVSKVSVDTLAAHGFDLSRRLGTILAEQQDISDLRSIKAVYEALFIGYANLKAALSDDDLRLLSERRHLVVHRRGLVDAAYAMSTACRERPGDRLKVSPDALEQHIKTCAQAVCEVLKAVASDTTANSERAAG